MDRRDVHFPAKSVRRKPSHRSHGRDLLHPVHRRHVDNRRLARWIRHGNRRDLADVADAAQSTIATLPTAVLVLPKQFTTSPPQVALNPTENTPAGDVLGASTSAILSLPTVGTDLASVVQNVTRALTLASLGPTALSNGTTSIPSPTVPLAVGTTEAATIPPLSTINSLLSQVATSTIGSVVTPASTFAQVGTNTSVTASSGTLFQPSNLPTFTLFQNTTTSGSQTGANSPPEGIIEIFSPPTTGTSLSLSKTFPTFTAPLNITGSVPIPTVLTSATSIATSAVGNLTETSFVPTSATNVENSLTSELPTSSTSLPVPFTEIPGTTSTEEPASQTSSEQVSSTPQETILSTTTPEASISTTEESPSNSFTPTDTAAATTLSTVNPSDIINNLPSNLTTLPFPSVTSIPTFFNLSATSFPTTSNIQSINGTLLHNITTQYTRSNTPSTAGFTWVSPTGANIPSATGIPPPAPTLSSSGSPSATSTSAVVPLVPAIVGSLGGMVLLAALGVLLLAVRRRRTRPTSTLLGTEHENPFMTEGDFTVLSGQRLGTGISGRTPVVYRQGGSPTSGITVTPTAPSGRAPGLSRFMEDL